MSKYELYLNAFHNVIKERIKDEKDRHYLKQNIFYCVKVINMKPKPDNYEEAHSDFQLHSVLKQMIEQLTPYEFMQLFPIKKEYDGHKYGMKDYFYTKSYIDNELEIDKLIPDALFFLSEYWNDDIHKACMKMMGNLSDLRQMQGKPTIMEEWVQDNGIETHTGYIDDAGNEFVMDQHGRTQKVNKPKSKRPKYLKLVQ